MSNEKGVNNQNHTSHVNIIFQMAFIMSWMEILVGLLGMVAATDRWGKCIMVILGSCLGTGTLRHSDVSASTVPPMCMYNLKRLWTVIEISINQHKNPWYTWLTVTMQNGISRSF